MLDVHADAEPQVCYPDVYRFRLDAGSETDRVKPELDELRPALAEAPRHDANIPAWWKAVVAARLAGSARDSRTENGFLSRLSQAFRRSAA